ncbi:uncharacterized protein LOC114362987 [Ostrinia furnacalis]|uniref:uncharacterized protein LOC114362987 n=1 Tax=Ostrinia furnacalis TaxID=93504 RepID=UPI00103E30D3|nr:uncharacterized protein LOC114362987 [Ostrinia furnacalis]
MMGDSDSVSAVRSRRTLSLVYGVYAGLIACFVPLVICNPDGFRPLSYDTIFNNTNYAQLQHNSRPYSLPVPPVSKVDRKNHTYSLEEDSRGNELEIDYDFSEKDEGGPLLVGYARDPFRYSIPEKDFLRGVRYMSPQTISSSSGSENRGKRGVLELYNMIYCATGCEPLAYKGYGCYCGFLGSGRPTDGIDRCCKQHDRCYENMFCPVFSVYFQPYYWKCYHGEPLCALENYESQHGFINACAARLCECDREFAMCVRRYACPRKRALCRSSPLRLLQNLLMFR